MHSVLGWRTWITAALAVCAAIVAVRISQGVEPLQAAQKGISWTSLAVAAFVLTPLWRLLWLFPWFQRKAPPLDGVWTGVVTSNRSIQEVVKEAAKQAGASAVDVDAVGIDLPALTEVKVTAVLRTSFVGITLELESAGDRYQTSSLKVVEMKPATDGSSASLHYIFEGRVLNPRPGDVSCFDGAASLTIRKDDQGMLYMEGPTWTNRAWTRGLNTAGLIHITRSKPEFWAALTFGLVQR
jgi:hypothetical protein